MNGLRFGEKIGRELAGRKDLEFVHLIGHSCGSFVVHDICRGMKEKRDDVSVQTTYLELVSNYGGIMSGFGIDTFGSCGYYSEAYIDKGDDVPGSNQRLSLGIHLT